VTDPRADPGWKVDWRLFVPGMTQVAMRAKGSPLATMRSVVMTFTVEVLLFGLVLALLDLEVEEGMSVGLGVAIVGAVGVASLVVGPRLRRLDPSSAGSLLASYRKRFFLRLALAEGTALLGFVFSFLSGSIVTYLAALPFTLLGFARLAPTAASIDRDEQVLRANGCAYPLYETLLG
jgi:hypothetical protein